MSLNQILPGLARFDAKTACRRNKVTGQASSKKNLSRTLLTFFTPAIASIKRKTSPLVLLFFRHKFRKSGNTQRGTCAKSAPSLRHSKDVLVGSLEATAQSIKTLLFHFILL